MRRSLTRWLAAGIIVAGPLLMGAEGCEVEDKTGQRGINDGKRDEKAKKLAEDMTKITRIVLTARGTSPDKRVQIQWGGRRPDQDFEAGQFWEQDYRIKSPTKITFIVTNRHAWGDVRCFIKNARTNENLSSSGPDTYQARCGYWYI
jgi:hypothetical protein